MTASELMAELNAHPKWRAARAREQEARDKIAAEWDRAEVPLVEELRSVGLIVDSVWDLVNSPAPYPNALPILLQHLHRSYPDAVREGIARALAVSEAKFAWNDLKRLYKDESERRAKSGLAVALAATADDETIHDLIELAKDTENESSRLLLLSALKRSSDPSAYKALVDLQNDPDLKKEIEVILRRVKRRKEASVKRRKEAFGHAAPVPMTDLVEASMNFDADMVGPFLERLSGLAAGFGPAQIDEVLKVVNELDVDEERQLDFRVTYQGDEVPMRISVFKDDIDAPDVYFFGPPALIEEINKLTSNFCEEHGI